MYEGEYYQFDAILGRMLDRVPDVMDKREGSVIYDALAPAALEIAESYVEMEANLDIAFADTATGEFLDAKVEERGMTRRDAVQAVRQVTGDAPMPIGTRYSMGTTYFTAITAGMVVQARADEAGTIGNLPGGRLSVLGDAGGGVIPGLTTATLGDIIIPGTEEESDEDLRERYFEFVRKPRTSGNKADYRAWALSVEGVGGVQVEPVWDGPNTVRLHLIDTNKRAVTPAVAQLVKEYINPSEKPDGGTGDGLAPVGAVLTVVPATEVPINISANLTLAPGATLQQVYDVFIPAFNQYLKDIAFESDEVILRYTRIQALLLGIPPIIDYTNLLLNGGDGNIVLGFGQVAVPGTVTFNAQS